MLFALLPSWAKSTRRGPAPRRARTAKIPPVTRLRRMAAPSFELRPQRLRASDFGVELPAPDQALTLTLTLTLSLTLTLP